MGSVTVNLLGRSFDISDQLPVFIPIMHSFEAYEGQLKQMVIQQAKRGTYSGAGGESFSYWENKIRSISRQVIKDASSYGIYDLTETELVDDNPGFKELNKVCNETAISILQTKTEATLEYMERADAAFDSAASGITGSGVSVWTSSFGSAMWYSFLEGNVLKKQAKQADKEYNAALNSLSKQRASKEKEGENKAKVKIYYPGCNNAISIIVTYMFRLFLESMNSAGKIVISEIDKYDLKKSLDVMNNLSIVSDNQKIEVLCKAFEWCPYNAEVYYRIIDQGYIDKDLADTINYIGLTNLIVAQYKEVFEDVPKVSIGSYFERNKTNLKAVSLLYGISEKTYKKQLTENHAINVTVGYAGLKRIINSEEECTEFVAKIQEPIDKYISNYIDKIVSPSDFAYLKNECDHAETLEMIRPDGFRKGESKSTIDKYYLEKLIERCEPLYKKRVEDEEKEKKEQEKIQEQKRAEKELAQKKKRKKNRIIVATALSVIVLCFIVVVVIVFVIPRIRLKKANDYLSQGDYDKALELYMDLGPDDYTGQIKETLNGFSDQKEYDKVINACNSLNAEEFAEIQNKCQYEKSILLHESGNYSEAKESFELVRDGYKDKDKYLELYDVMDTVNNNEIYETLKSIDYPENNKLVLDYLTPIVEKQCEELLKSKEYLKCVNLCQQYKIKNDTYYQANYELGIQYCEEEKYRMALRCFDLSGDYKKKAQSEWTLCMYQQSIIDAGRGELSFALEGFHEVLDYQDASDWYYACEKANEFKHGYYYAIDYKLYDSTGNIIMERDESSVGSSFNTIVVRDETDGLLHTFIEIGRDFYIDPYIDKEYEMTWKSPDWHYDYEVEKYHFYGADEYKYVLQSYYSDGSKGGRVEATYRRRK